MFDPTGRGRLPAHLGARRLPARLPVGLSFFAGAFAEPTLIGYAYAFEQATTARRQPTFAPTLPT